MELLEDILKNTPEAVGRLLVDLINEPDGYSLTWDVRLLPVESVRDHAACAACAVLKCLGGMCGLVCSAYHM